MVDINMDRRQTSVEIVSIQNTLKSQDEQLLRTEERMITIERNLLANTQATLRQATLQIEQAEQLKIIANNTEPLISLVTDLTAGTRFFCRLALGITFILDKVDKFWKPALFIIIVMNLLLDHQLPVWVNKIIGFFKVL